MAKKFIYLENLSEYNELKDKIKECDEAIFALEMSHFDNGIHISIDDEIKYEEFTIGFDSVEESKEFAKLAVDFIKAKKEKIVNKIISLELLENLED